MTLGSFLLFTKTEIGTVLTDNVLGTRIDPQSDVALEFAPNLRRKSNWSPAFLQRGVRCRRKLVQRFLGRGRQDDIV